MVIRKIGFHHNSCRKLMVDANVCCLAALLHANSILFEYFIYKVTEQNVLNSAIESSFLYNMLTNDLYLIET